MSPLLTCPCGTPVDVDDPPHGDLVAAGATVLCPTCDGDDLARRRATVDADAAALQADRNARILELMLAAGVPPRACTAAIADPPARRFEPTDAQALGARAGTAWARSGGILTLAGPKGTGKTTVAARAVLRRLAYGHPVAWRYTSELVAGVWSNDDAVRSAAERILHHGTGALVLDDLDSTKSTSAGLDTLGQLVDRWYRTEQPLLVTTNALAPGDFVAQYGRTGERIASRLQAGPWVVVDGPDLRRAE